MKLYNKELWNTSPKIHKYIPLKKVVYVKKLWSLNPTKYKYVSLKEAMKNYKFYLGQCYLGKSEIHRCMASAKTFEQWLTTEI